MRRECECERANERESEREGVRERELVLEERVCEQDSTKGSSLRACVCVFARVYVCVSVRKSRKIFA